MKEFIMRKGLEMKEDVKIEKGLEMKEDVKIGKGLEMKEDVKIGKGLEMKEDVKIERDLEMKKGIRVKGFKVHKGIKILGAWAMVFSLVLGYPGILGKAKAISDPRESSSAESSSAEKPSAAETAASGTGSSPEPSTEMNTEPVTGETNGGNGGNTPAAAPPVIRISRREIKKPIKAGKSFQAVLIVENKSKEVPIENARLSIETGEGLLSQELTGSLDVGKVGAQREKSCKLHLKTAEEIQSEVQTITVKLEYDYQTSEGMIHEQKEEKIMIPTEVSKNQGAQDPNENEPVINPLEGSGGGDSSGGDTTPTEEKKEIDTPVPNVIVSKYEYGDKVTAGKEFHLKLQIKNTSSITAAENMIMSLELGDALAITNSSNSFYIDKIGPGGVLEKEVTIKALANGKPENSKVDISFKYEYVHNKTRTQATSAEKLSIPVIQPDRFKVNVPQSQEEMHQFAEATLSLPYVNKGKSAVYNVEASLEGDVETAENYKYLGNFESGSNGTIDFLITPQNVGKQEVQVKIKYEDSSNKSRTITIAVPLHVTEPQDPAADMNFGEEAGMGEEMPPEGGTNILPYAAGVGGFVVVLIVVIAVVKKRKRKKAFLYDEFEDQDDEE